MQSFIVAAWVGSGVGVVQAHCDLVEINHYLDSVGGENFVQIIAWDWSPDYCRHHAQQWMICTEWDHVGKTTTARHYDGQEIEVRSPIFRETWTTWDAEYVDRGRFDPKFRRKVW